ncbi:MAG: hypothetical protein ABIG11_05820 [bacterium]
MENIADNKSSASSNSSAGAGPFHYRISVKFIDTANVNTRLNAFDALKKLGTFSVQDQKKPVYILDFKSKFAKDKMEERLKELASSAKLFDCTIEEILSVSRNGRKQ